MLITDKDIRIKELNDIFTEHQTYHRMNLACRLTALKYCQYARKNSDQKGNVISFPQTYPEYDIQISGEAFNCFENHPINIYVSFKKDRNAWKTYRHTIQKVINAQIAVLVSSDIYNVLDGEINFYNPNIICSP